MPEPQNLYRTTSRSQAVVNLNWAFQQNADVAHAVHRTSELWKSAKKLGARDETITKLFGRFGVILCDICCNCIKVTLRFRSVDYRDHFAAKRWRISAAGMPLPASRERIASSIAALS